MKANITFFAVLIFTGTVSSVSAFVQKDLEKLLTTGHCFKCDLKRADLREKLYVSENSEEIDNAKKSDTEFALTFPTPGLYTLTDMVNDSADATHTAKVWVAAKDTFTQEDMLDMQADIESLGNIYRSQIGSIDIETVRQHVLDAARSNPDFSSAALSSGALCLIYKDLIPFILDLPDPNGPVTDGSSVPRKLKKPRELK